MLLKKSARVANFTQLLHKMYVTGVWFVEQDALTLSEHLSFPFYLYCFLLACFVEFHITSALGFFLCVCVSISEISHKLITFYSLTSAINSLV